MYMQPGELADSIALTPGEIDDWQPDLVRALIAASRGVEQLTGQRFWPDPDAAQVRYYTADRDIVRTDPIITLTSLDVDYARRRQLLHRAHRRHRLRARAAQRRRRRQPVHAHPPALRRTARRSTAGTAGRSARKRMRVTGKFGWPSVPEPIVQATGILANRLLKRFREAPFGALAGIGLDGAGLREQQLDRDPELGFLLAPYRRTRLFV
jgi:hypothetical protein